MAARGAGGRICSACTIGTGRFRERVVKFVSCPSRKQSYCLDCVYRLSASVKSEAASRSLIGGRICDRNSKIPLAFRSSICLSRDRRPSLAVEGQARDAILFCVLCRIRAISGSSERVASSSLRIDAKMAWRLDREAVESAGLSFGARSVETEGDDWSPLRLRAAARPRARLSD